MILTAFALLDNKAGFFNAPFYFPTNAQALRTVTDLLGDFSTTIARHPQDYDLYVLGTWDDQTGLFTSDRVHVANCAALVEAAQRIRTATQSPSLQRSMFSGNGMDEEARS